MQTARQLAPSRSQMFRSFDKAFLDAIVKRAITPASVSAAPVSAPTPANDSRRAPAAVPDVTRLPIEDYMLNEAAWIRMHGW